jgi:peptidyl-prolyl cis-trans isomerase SurA
MKRQAFSVLSRLNPWQRLLVSAVLVTLAAPAAAQLRAPGSSSGSRTQGIFMQPSAPQNTVAPSQPQMGVPQPQSGQKRSQLVDEVVAIVNNSVITRRELLTAPTRSRTSCARPIARFRRVRTCWAKCSNAW